MTSSSPRSGNGRVSGEREDSALSRYFSERERGPRARTNETFTPNAWGGIVAHIDARITNGAFGHSFPDECSDGHGTIGTSTYTMGLAVAANIPELAETGATATTRATIGGFTGWPLRADEIPPTLAILDLVEFCFDHVAEPTRVGHHDFYRHDHLRFDQPAGRGRWRSDVNTLFARNGIAYELTVEGQVIRLGTPIATDAVRTVVFATGDSQLDDLLERARRKYLSADPAERSEALEQLWDAFERSKTILDPDKKTGSTALIERVASSPELANQLTLEARALTTIGNDFKIRHHETNKAPVAVGDVDYLFHRCFAFVAHVLSLNPTPSG